MLLNGKQLAQKIRSELKNIVTKKNLNPGLGIILVGERVDSATYVRMKKRACDEVGIRNIDVMLPETITQDELISKVDELNDNVLVDGILIQLPLPKHIDEREVLNRVLPEKDVDGFNAINIGSLALNDNPKLTPCTPTGVIRLLKEYDIDLEGKDAVMVGRSNIVGMPLALMLKNENATVTLCHSRTKDLSMYTKQADIIISACGKVNLITADMVKEGVIIVDIGINSVPDATRKRGYRLVGDVDFENVKEKASFITPVPGGVGPMTIAMLLKHTIDSNLSLVNTNSPS
jgi:methylenetetrahydrofolate dehydrogenase (NADP+) / methenyltetrahydrofolate cyclohydrolase